MSRPHEHTPDAPPRAAPPPTGGRLEMVLEWILWRTRLMMLVPIIGLLVSAGYFVVQTVTHVAHGLHQEDDTEALVLHVEAMDSSLLAAALVIFALGLYELFISKLNHSNTDIAGGLLVIESLDDLKTKLAKIIIMLLGVKFFKLVQTIQPQTQMEMLLFSGGIVGVALALYLVKSKHE